MKSDCEPDSRKKRVVNIVEVGDDGPVYIRLDNGKKYLLNGSGCWRCGSTADCFGNMDGNELEVICEFDFSDEVKNLSIVLLQEQLVETMSWLLMRTHGKQYTLVNTLVQTFNKVVKCINAKRGQ